MLDVLAAVHLDRWVLPALLVWPALGSMLIFMLGGTTWQAVVDLPWIPDWGARVTLGVDGISLVMIVMTSLLMPLAVYGSWSNVASKVRSYYGLLLILLSGMMGVFTALDLLLFYVFWELVLIPTYFMIGVSGGARRSRASLKYFLFTTLGSLLMLVSIIVVWIAGGARSFNIHTLI